MNDLTIRPLQAFVPGLDRFTYPRYRELLRDVGPPSAAQGHIAVAAWLGEAPAGLALLSPAWTPAKPEADATATPEDSTAALRTRRLLSVMVHPMLRRAGVGSALLAQAEAAASGADAQKLVAVHSSRLATAPAFEALLRRAGWSDPEVIEHRLAGYAAWAVQARSDWARLLQRLVARGYSVGDWTTMNDADRAEILHLVREVMPESDRIYDPLARAELLAPAMPELSLLLRRHGRIVGWIRGARGTEAGVFNYTHGYVLPELQRHGWLQAGVREVCERQHALFGPRSLSIFETAATNDAMQRFMERGLGPYREWTDTRYVTRKHLD